MSGRIHLSLDCEGLWGVCDVIGPRSQAMTHASLLDTYRRLTGMLGRANAGATFAVTGLFALPAEAFDEYASHFEACEGESAGWYSFVLKEWRARGGDGFHLPELQGLVESVPSSKVWQHGLTHLPATAQVSDRVLEREYVSAGAILAGFRGFQPGIIFPRNLPASARVLERAGITCYRDSRESSMSRFRRSLRRANPSTFVSGAPPWREGGRGVRAVFGGNIPLFPDRIPGRMYDMYLDALVHSLVSRARRGQVAHVWLHPENLIGRPALFAFFERLLSSARLDDGSSLVSAIDVADHAA